MCRCVDEVEVMAVAVSCVYPFKRAVAAVAKALLTAMATVREGVAA
jgi:hypothetical protein